VRYVAIALAVIALAGLVRSRSGAGGAPPLEVSCTKPALAVARTSAAEGADVAFSVVGPDDATFVLTVDSSAVKKTDFGLEVVPAPSAKRARVLVNEFGMLNCRKNSVLRLELDRGDHTIGLFRVDGTPSPILDSVNITVE
jgi:hypothetical protein